MYKILKTFNTLSEVVIVDHDGKVEVIAYTHDASDPPRRQPLSINYKRLLI